MCIRDRVMVVEVKRRRRVERRRSWKVQAWEFQVDVFTSDSPSVGSARRSSEAIFAEGDYFRGSEGRRPGSPAFASEPAADTMVRRACL